MFWQVFISAFILGSISSFHCVGMCGPLALSLPVGGLSPIKKAYGILLYNMGRIATYSLLGLMFGLLGRQVSIAGLQQGFSIIIGIIIIAGFMLTVLHKRFAAFKPVSSFYTKVQILVARFLRYKHMAGFFFTGLANGLLPCGMVYLAITGAMATYSPWYGMEFMAAFGLATIPVLLMLSVAGMIISVQARNFMRRLTPYAFLVMGILLILRGMNLGIPFISPVISSGASIVDCH